LALTCQLDPVAPAGTAIAVNIAAHIAKVSAGTASTFTKRTHRLCT
jgi:hypothetical protein